MNWYKGNLHCHTTNSDGHLAPIEVIKYYRSLGYDFLGISDHNRLTPASTAENAGILEFQGIPNCEYSGPHRGHVLAVNAHKPAKPDPTIDRAAMSVSDVLQDGVNKAQSVDAIPVLCHPFWIWTWDYEDAIKVKGWRHFELLNAAPDCNAYPTPHYSPADELWDKLLSSGYRVYGIASDDAHRYYDALNTRASLGGRGWIVVRAPELSRAAVVEGFREGRFYASTGVELDTYRVNRGSIELDIVVHNEEKCCFEFFGKEGRLLGKTIGHKAEYAFEGNEEYVRVRIASTGGVWAWTQPVFLDDLDKEIAWTGGQK